MSYRLRKEQLEKTFRPREEWWSRVFASPIAHYILLFIADKKLITPNRLTLISFGLTFFTAAIIISGVKGSLLLAAIILQFAYIVDCMDGQLARYRQTSSKFGSFFDKWSDYVKFPFVLFALIIRSLNEKYSIFVLSTGILSIFLICYLPYLRILTKAEFSIHPWNVFSNKNFKQRNLRFFGSVPPFTQSG